MWLVGFEMERHTTFDSHLKSPRPSCDMASSYVTEGGDLSILEPHRIFLQKRIRCPDKNNVKQYRTRCAIPLVVWVGRKSFSGATTKGRAIREGERKPLYDGSHQ